MPEQTPNMAMRVVPHGERIIVLWLHTHEAPQAAVWERAVNELSARVDAGELNTTNIAGLVISDGGSPNAKQRRAYFHGVFHGRAHRSSLITPPLDALRLGVFAAARWVSREFRAFRAHEFRQALKHLGLEEGVWAVMLPTLLEMQAGMDRPVETLANIASYMSSTVPSTPGG